MSRTAEIALDRIIVGDRYRKKPGDIKALAESIAAVGLLQPVVVRVEKDRLHLVSGWRRLEALKLLGVGIVPYVTASSLPDAMSALRAEQDENTCREPFARSEGVAIAKAVEAVEKEAAAARAKAGRPLGTLPRGRARDKAAAAGDMSRRTLDAAEKVVDAANDETLPDDVRAEAESAKEEMDKTGNAAAAARRVKRVLAWTEAVGVHPIMADVPEQWRSEALDGARALHSYSGQEKKRRTATFVKWCEAKIRNPDPPAPEAIRAWEAAAEVIRLAPLAAKAAGDLIALWDHYQADPGEAELLPDLVGGSAARLQELADLLTTPALRSVQG